MTAAPGSTTVTAGDNNSYAKAGDVATAITNVGKASKTTVTSNDSSVTVVSKVDSGDGHVNYDLSIDTSKVAANTNLTYKANSGTGLTTTLANGLDFKDGDNTVATVGPNGEVKYSLNSTVAGINSITTNGGNTVINDSGITTPKVTINNAPTVGTDATNKDYVDSTKTKVTSNDSSVVINKTTSGNQDVYDLSVDVTKLDAANKSLSNINNDGNKVISDIARKSVDVAAGTNIKNIVKNDVQNSDGTTTTTYTINANGARVVAGDGVTVATGTPGSDNITDYTVSVKNTTLTAAPGSTIVTAGDNNSYAKAGDVATAITNVGKASKTTVTSNDSSVTVVSKVDSGDGHVNYDLSVDTSKVAANTNLTYKANSGTGLTTTLANGLDFKDGDNTVATVGPNGEVKYSLNPTVAGINSITTNGGNTVINDNGITTPSLTLTNSTPLTSSTGGKVTVPAGTGNQVVTGQTVANAINKLGDNTINLKASDGNITTKQSLNKDGGLEFNITGSNGITTTASGDTINVTIAQSGLNTSTTGGKTTVTGGNTYATARDVATAIQNAVNNSGWNAVAGSTGTGTTSGSVSNKLITSGETVKLQAGDNLNVDQSGGTFTYSLKNDINVNSITAGNNKFDTSGLTISDAAGNKAITTPSGTTYTNAAGNTTVINPTGVVINKSAADPSKSVSLTDNGLDNGGNKITNVAAGVDPTDAVNVSQLDKAINKSTYNGPVVYTNAAGEKIVKVNGNYYKASDVDVNGNLLPGAVAINPSDIQHSLLNADGSTTNPSTLDNVGKGKISSSSKQAINGSQLNNLGTQLGLTVDPSGTGFSNPTFAGLKNVNGSTGAAPTTFKDAVDQTIAKVNEGIIYGADNNTAGTRQQLGSRLTVESGDFASGGVNYKGQNLETSYVSDGAGNGKIIVGITENPEFNSVKAKTFTADDGAGNTTVTNGQGTTITDAAGNKNVATAAGNTYTNAAGNTTTVNSSGVTINKSAADPSKSVSLTNSGLDNGGNRITNIAAGVAPTDAVNVSQLGNAVNNLTTAINASKSEVIGGTNTTVTSSTGSNGQIVYKVDADGTTVSGGSSFVSVTQGTKDANNITDYKVDLAQGTKDKLNSIGTGNIAAGDNNTVTGSTVHNYIQNNPLTYTDDNGTTVTRNLGQNLNIMGRATGPLTTGNIGVVAAGPDTLELRLAENIDLGPNGRVTMGKTVVNDDGIKITGGPSVTSSGIDAGGKKVTNIAEGDISPTSNDAVTGRQVYNAISAGAADKATRAELAGVNNNLTAGIAGVAAMANLPQINDSASNRFNIAVAGGAYKNGRAMALGFSGVSDGGRFVYRASASLNSKRDVAVGLGVGYQFGKRDVMPNELDRMKSMVALIEEQKDSYSRQLKQQLEQESRKNQENSELIRQLMQEVQELKSKSNVSNRSNRS
ncbi:Autotransporter adhesin UpaG [uncultured Leptotrichia sp.]|uniref:beta strand repeat-containing protein n=1 Tax=uncultured Leptotrichia sp. TaxID=159271 RepID=UPI001A61B58B|nr:YadA C-terminal domain-containing protein [uncultured Leptotrichia sp.]VTX49041.1 Autotransporter adhesin UpaG [uncultured Leptotrichia sp.]